MPELVIKAVQQELKPKTVMSPGALEITANVASRAIDIAHEVFMRHDVDGNGLLDFEEMASVMLSVLRELGSEIPADIEEVSTPARFRFLILNIPVN